MPASIRKLDGDVYEVRTGPDHHEYGDPWKGSILNVIVRGNEAELSGLSIRPSKAFAGELNSLLRGIGVTSAFYRRMGRDGALRRREWRI